MKRKEFLGEVFLYSYNLGYANESRVKDAVTKGLLVADREGKDYLLTLKILEFDNFWKWLRGDCEYLYSSRPKEEIEQPVKRGQKERADLFKGM